MVRSAIDSIPPFMLTTTGAVPKFTETSSPELDSHLDHARRKIIIPAHLSKEQQDLIYKPKNKKILASEGGKAMIGEEELTLEHINKAKDQPKGYTVLWEAIDLMQERRDWDNLPRLLHGLNNASTLKLNKPRNAWKKEKLVRRLGLAGRQDVLLECVRQSAVTGLTLDSGRFAGQVLHWIQTKAVDSDYEAEETSKALKWAELVATMMEDPSHAGSKYTGKSWLASEVPGILLELAAVRASKYLGGVDQDGKVAEYARRLVQSLPEDAEHADKSSGWIIPAERESLSKWMRLHVPILYGMKQAATVLEQTSDLAKQLGIRTKGLEVMISKHGKELLSEPDSNDGWLDGYTKLFPDAPLN